MSLEKKLNEDKKEKRKYVRSGKYTKKTKSEIKEINKQENRENINFTKESFKRNEKIKKAKRMITNISEKNRKDSLTSEEAEISENSKKIILEDLEEQKKLKKEFLLNKTYENMKDESMNKKKVKHEYENLKENEFKNLRSNVEHFLKEIQNSSYPDKNILNEEINDFFKIHPQAIRYLYSQSYSLINRLHLMTKINVAEFNYESLTIQIKDAFQNSERINLESEEIKKKSFKDKEAINISYYLNCLFDKQKISIKEFEKIKKNNGTILKQKMFREGEKMFSDYKFKDIKKRQRQDWENKRKIKDDEIENLYKKNNCDVTEILNAFMQCEFENLISEEISGKLNLKKNKLTDNSHISINSKKLFTDLEILEDFEEVQMETMHYFLNYADKNEKEKADIKKSIFDVFRKRKSILKLKDLCAILTKIQQDFVIEMNLTEDFNFMLMQFFKDDCSLKVEVCREKEANNSIKIPSSELSIEDFFEILQIRMNINNLA